ncbi:MAG: WYL domain-containing protein [Verrucomicrobiae bacterium]|nr:WYL domain-containing protein [Verrucomicrobiae bacterium]
MAANHPAPRSQKKSAKRRTGDTRRPLERILQIHDQINRGRYPNCGGMAKELGYARKTIQRDVSFMRDELGLPIAYDDNRHGYCYTKPVGDFPYLRATAEDLVALIVARHALSHLGDTPLVASLRSSFQKMQQGMQDRVSIPWSDLDHAFSVKSTGLTNRDVAVFEKIARAVLERVELRFDYAKLSATKAEPRRVQPYHLAEIDGGWYLIGHDLDRDARRTFAVQRMKGLSLTNRKFIRPSDFRLEDHFAGSFGVWTDPKTAVGKPARKHRIRIRFRGFAAKVIPERRWHPTQEITLLSPAQASTDSGRSPGHRRSSRARSPEPEEVIELRMELSTLEDIRRWILSFGSQAEVLEPKELREWVWKEAVELVGRG